MTPTALVLLPGLDGTGILFRPLLEHLPAELHSIVVSYPSDQPGDYDALLPIVLRSLPRDLPFVLLGESFSGPLAIMAAATRPKGLVGVVLCASFVRNPLWLPAQLMKLIIRPTTFRWFGRLSPAKALLGARATPELRGLLAEAIGVVRPEVVAARVRALLDVDVRDQLRSLPVPLLYLLARFDRLVAARNVRDVVAVFPKARVVTIDSPHLILQTQPHAAAEAITGFVNEVERSQPTGA